MKATAFVCASAVLFATWLTITYLHETSPKDYPTLGRGSIPVTAQRMAPASHTAPMISLQGEEDAPVATRSTPAETPAASTH